MGWSALKTQVDKMQEIMDWQSTQAEYTKDKGNFVFFELTEKADYDHNHPLELTVIEVIKGVGYVRGYLLIKGDGTVVNRTYVDLPDFNKNCLQQSR